MIYKTHCSGKKQVVIAAQCIIYVNARNLYFFLTCIYVDFKKSVTKLRTALPREKAKEIGIADMIKRDFGLI